nr:hypothetical protein [candidate division Zixibacteria bacterium]
MKSFMSLRLYKMMVFLPMVLTLFGVIFIMINQPDGYYYPALWTGAVAWISLSFVYKIIHSGKADPGTKSLPIFRICGSVCSILTGAFGFFVPCINMPEWKGYLAIAWCIILMISGLLLLIAPMLFQTRGNQPIGTDKT